MQMEAAAQHTSGRPDRAGAQVQPSPDARAFCPARKSVLLVDDTPEVLQMLQFFLVRAGFDVVASRSANQALAASEQVADRFGVLVADIGLGAGLSGTELATQLLHRNPALAVIYISGSRADLWDPALFIEGINYLPKPFSPAILARMVGERLATN